MDSVAKALQLKKELDQLRPIKPEDERRIMDKFRLDWNYHSNNLEGNSLTYGETKALILFGITAQGKPLKDHFEITGHNEAINLVLDVVKEERPLSENFIRELHKLLLKESYETDAITPDGKPTKKRITIGAYKTQPNHVKTKTGEIFRFSTPEETPALMHDLMEWLGEKKAKGLNPVLVAAEFHYRFIRIHPFDDGNGRVARILMNFILMQYGFPPVIIKTEDKENYFAVLRLADAGQIEPFIEYIGSNLVRSLEIMIRGAAGESIEEPDDLDKEIKILYEKAKRVGGKIRIVKNQNALLGFYSGPFKKLLDGFLEANRVFEDFYFQKDFIIYMNGNGITGPVDNQLFLNLEKVTEDLEGITISTQFKTFNLDGFNEFNFTSSIQIGFSKTLIILAPAQGDFSLKKLYDDDITDKEIDSLIREEIKRHKEFIEKKIKDAENKRS
ncbi:MAG: Fic family protein [Imperialibacter sp.]|uniref:Fic family protein n=1 Tax=Imperialibacter sp. TaxID=2038411 RepID=UPI0032EDD062